MRYRYVIILALVAATLVSYWRVGNNDFVTYDDLDYVVQNPHVQTMNYDTIIRTFTSTDNANWHPLTWLSHMVDCQLYGLNPRGHHLTNVFFHIANTVFLFLLFVRMTGATWRSAFVAALFALHPLHVESVAWVAERKDVLSTLFFMLTLLAYARYAERPALARYVTVFCTFALGLMAKPMLVTLPFVLLLLDYWPLGRCAFGGQTGTEEDPGRGTQSVAYLFLEKVPLFLLAAASSCVALYAQKSFGAVVALGLAPFEFRVENALVSYVAYIGKMFWPTGLVFLYPPVMLPMWQVIGSALLLAAITIAVIRWARPFPFLSVGWLWFLGTLVPVIGLVQVGVQSMADRYTYIPLIGLFVIVAWGVPTLAKNWCHHRRVLAVSAIGILAVFSVCTWRQTGYWKNSIELYSHALKFNNDNYIAHEYLGNALADQGRYEEAISHYEEFLRINPDYEVVHYRLGIALEKLGRIDEAIGQYQEALRINPADSTARSLLETARTKGGMHGSR